MDTTLPSRRFELQPAPRAARQALADALFNGALVFFLVAAMGSMGSMGGLTQWLLAAAVALPVVVTGYLVRRPPRAPAAIVLESDHLLLPGHRRRPVRIPYRDLRIVHGAGSAADPRLVMGLRGRLARSFPASAFVEPDAIGQIVDELRRRLALQPQGVEQLMAMGRRGEVNRRMYSGGAPVSKVCAGVLLAVYALQGLRGEVTDTVTLLALGANFAGSFTASELWRLVAANLLHGGFWHFALNALSLVGLGVMLESLLGPRRYLAILLLSSLGGAAASTLALQLGSGSLLSLGASTGISGLVGAYAWLRWRYRHDFPQPPSISFWLLLVATFALPALIVPNLDHGGHLGGLLTGLVVTAAAVRGPDLLAQRARPDRAWGVLAAVLAVPFLLAVAHMVRVQLVAPPEHFARAADLLLAPQRPPEQVNELAWYLVISEQTPPAVLQQARQRMEGVVAAQPHEQAYADTLATACYRTGDLARAIELERAIVDAPSERPPFMDSFYLSQLARFEWAHYRRHGVLRRGTPPALDLQLSAGNELAPSIAGGVPGSASRVHALLLRQDRPVAFVRAWLGSSDTGGSWPHSQHLRLPEELPRPLSVRVTSLEALPAEGAPPDGEVRWQLSALEPQVLALP